MNQWASSSQHRLGQQFSPGPCPYPTQPNHSTSQKGFNLGQVHIATVNPQNAGILGPTPTVRDPTNVSN